MKGILFKPDLFSATIQGSKTQTRRLIKYTDIIEYPAMSTQMFFNKNGIPISARYKPGEIVYLKEPFALPKDLTRPIYKYNTISSWNGKYKNKLFMPASAARYFILITNVQAQKLQNITEEEAIKEGVNKGPLIPFGSIGNTTYRDEFFIKWLEINGGKSLELNPYVWVYTYRLIQPNENYYCIQCKRKDTRQFEPHKTGPYCGDCDGLMKLTN